MQTSEFVGEETAALSLQNHQDVLNLIKKIVQDGNDAVSRCRTWTIESYLNGDVVIVLRLHCGPEKFNLIFGVVPLEELSRLDHEAGNNRNHDIFHTDQGRRNQSVLIGVTETVQDEQRVIPSLVRLEFLNAVPNRLGNSGTPIQGSLEIPNILRERETTRPVCGIGMTSNDSAGVDGMIEAGPEIVDCVSDNYRDSVEGRRLQKSELMDFLSGIRIYFNGYFVRVFSVKVAQDYIKILNVMLRPSDLEPSTLKRT